MIWLLIFGSAVGVLFVCLLLEQLLFEHRPLPPVAQPAPPAAPSWVPIDMIRARTARADRGRHAKPEGPQ